MTTSTYAPALPQALTDWLKTHTRQETILDHRETVGLDWWNVEHAGLPGLPVAACGHTTGKQLLSRTEIFALADDAVEDETGTGALRLLWHTLAWGTGVKQRGNDKRIESIQGDIDWYAAQLRDAARLSRTDPAEAFETLCTNGVNTVKSFGPGFFTKFLYFAGGGNPDHPSLIVDSVVRATLYRETGRTNPVLAPRSQYLVGDYRAALEILKDWARDASESVGRPVAADEVEKWAFRP